MAPVGARWLSLLLALCFAPLSAASTPPLVSMAFDEVPVQRVLQALADHQQLNLVVAPEVKGDVSLRLADVPWPQALDIILRSAELAMEREGNVMMVFPAGVLLQRQRQQEAQRRRQEQNLPPGNLSMALRHADAQEVADSLNAQRGALLTASGSVTADNRTNTLFIRDSEQALAQLKLWVAERDLPLAQVQLAAHIVTMSNENLRELGVNWGLAAQESGARALRINNFSVSLPVETPTARAGFHLARINGRLLDLELMALEQENQVEIMASPRLVTAHQQTASIKQGTEIPYQVSSGASGSTSIEFKEAVLGMEVTPRILSGERITLNLRISQNMPGRAIRQGDDGEVLAIDKQEIQTQVTVGDGETVVLGGIFQQQKTRGEEKVPGLGDIPLLGRLFKKSTRQHQRRELVIFITPTLLKP
ncbi:DNA uptake porin HofQ [Affinibrenneria salicis]|uniref:DNA uptake porin HofQ n=2 Tax=Affinibrenneria salicis TaxID=2590031 RepID=A0A5J5FSS8_9GAMM|nr:DNA uptake porin HofQ [Affinibrenneria salicis]